MNKHLGSTLDSWLEEEGIRDQVHERASALARRKQTFAKLVRDAMQAKKVSQAELARRMGTSRTVVNRVLDPTDVSLTLDTMVRVESALRTDFLFAAGKRAPVEAKRPWLFAKRKSAKKRAKRGEQS